VRQGAVGTGGDDRGERRLAAELADPRLGRAGDVQLAATGKPALDRPFIGGVGELRRLGDRRQLGLVLSPTQLLDQPARRQELDPGLHRRLKLGTVGDAGRRVVEANPAGKVRSELRDQALDRDAVLEALGDLPPGALDVAEVGDEDPRLRADHGQGAGAGEAGQPADVGDRLRPRIPGADEVADDQGVELTLGHQLGEALSPLRRRLHNSGFNSGRAPLRPAGSAITPRACP
jgi:hypothetical protein